MPISEIMFFSFVFLLGGMSTALIAYGFLGLMAFLELKVKSRVLFIILFVFVLQACGLTIYATSMQLYKSFPHGKESSQ